MTPAEDEEQQLRDSVAPLLVRAKVRASTGPSSKQLALAWGSQERADPL
jgi:hypothetical protein